MEFRSLPGLIRYAEASALQQELLEKRVRDEIDDTVLFLEHAPVVTRGRGLQFTGQPRERAMPLVQPLPEGIEYCESERGGDLTYHGPGQLVVYPIWKIRDLGAYLRGLESAFIEVLGELGLRSEPRENATGVWVGERKVASIGVAVRKWVTYHGVALNVVNDLKPFHLISPCGFAPEVMTSLAELLPERSEWRDGAGASSSWRVELEERVGRALVQVSYPKGRSPS